MTVIRGRQLTTFDVSPDGFQVSFGLALEVLRMATHSVSPSQPASGIRYS